MKKLLIGIAILLSFIGCGKEEFSIEKDLAGRMSYLIPEKAQKELQIQQVEISGNKLIINREFQWVYKEYEENLKSNIVLGLDDFGDLSISMKNNPDAYNTIQEVEINYYLEFTTENNKMKKIFGYTVKKEDAKNISIDTTTLSQLANLAYDVKGDMDTKYYFNSYK